ncbi:MAG: hypothetical protein HFJ45_03415 [Clostridia bacterium]|nr:hypothetical protein [Clostridia bacterium]
MKKKIISSIVILLIIVLLVFVGNLIRKVFILKDIKQNIIQNADTKPEYFYTKIESNIAGVNGSKYDEIWYSPDIKVHNEDNERMTIAINDTIYEVLKSQKVYYKVENVKNVERFFDVLLPVYEDCIPNYSFEDSLLTMALNLKINTKNINGKECYELKYKDNENKSEIIYYISCDDYFCLRREINYEEKENTDYERNDEYKIIKENDFKEFENILNEYKEVTFSEYQEYHSEDVIDYINSL